MVGEVCIAVVEDINEEVPDVAGVTDVEEMAVEDGGGLVGAG